MNLMNILSIVLVYRNTVAVNGNPSCTSSQYTYAMKGYPHAELQFTLKLTNELYSGNKMENVIFSPHSIYSALATINLASSGDTRAEISKVMGTDDNFTVCLNNVTQDVNKYLENSKLWNISIANGIFLQKSFQLKSQFIEQTNHFQISHVDFTTKEPAATEFINKYISSKTEGRIPKLFESNLPEDTKLALVNSIYFSARWEKQFLNQSTKTGKFNTGSEEIDVEMMTNNQQLSYINDPEGSFELICLPYENETFFMLIVLPYTNQTLKNVIQYLNLVNPLSLIYKFEKKDVEYKVPKMKFAKVKSLKDHLIKLGMSKAFSNADFSNMVLSNDLTLSDLVHGAEIEIDEQGTTASGATAGVFNIYSSSIPDQESVKFYVNRPFLFFIINAAQVPSSLFSAVVHNPEQV